MTIKILLAGKELNQFQRIRNFFDNQDVVIITATSIALALFLARKNMPDIIIVQENLIDGTRIILEEEIQNEPELAKIPFLCWPASSDLRLLKDEIARLYLS